jgi:serine/threonine protein kinase
VAVKVVERVAGPESAQLLWEAQFEALVALQRAHENVVPTYDFIRDEATGSVWIVQELCSLGDVASQFRQGALHDAQGRPRAAAIVQTALEIARGMGYLHSQSVMHGDLSSNNVLLSAAENSRGFVAKVSDFGLARVSNRELSTQSLGTVSHMAPELLMEGRMTPASDVFSYGVMLFELWMGQRAWSGSSVGHVIFNVTVKNTRLPLPETAPPALVALCEECVRTDREERPTFEEIVPRLEELLTTLPKEEEEQEGSESGAAPPWTLHSINRQNKKESTDVATDGWNIINRFVYPFTFHKKSCLFPAFMTFQFTCLIFASHRPDSTFHFHYRHRFAFLSFSSGMRLFPARAGFWNLPWVLYFFCY